MREHNRDKERLKHILDAIQVIENGLNAYSKEELLNSYQQRNVVVYIDARCA